MCLERVVPKGLLIPDTDIPTDPSHPTKRQQPPPIVGTGVPSLRWGREDTNEDQEDVPMSERLKALNINNKDDYQQKKSVKTCTSQSTNRNICGERVGWLWLGLNRSLLPGASEL